MLTIKVIDRSKDHMSYMGENSIYCSNISKQVETEASPKPEIKPILVQNQQHRSREPYQLFCH